MKKQIFSILTAMTMTLSAVSFTVSAETTEDTELWCRFLKYDLGITHYNSLSVADQELCHFIYDTETNAFFNDGEIAVCERARRIITNSKNYTARITIDDLKNQTLLCDLYSGYGFYNECTPDIIYLDDNVNKSEYWLDDEGKIKVVQQFNHTAGRSMCLIASALNEDDIYNNDFPYSDVLDIEENGNTYTVTYQLDFKNIVSVDYNFETDTFFYFDEETCSNFPLGDDFIIEDGNVYHIVDDDTVVLYISKYKNNLLFNENAEPVDIVVPEYVKGYNVRGICGQAFRMSSVRSVTLPNNTLDFIGDYAFEFCEQLTDINFPYYLKYIGQGAFRECISLESIDIDCEYLEIEDFAFTDCIKAVPSSINAAIIGENCFRNCSSFESISCGNYIRKISANAFRDCKNLKSIELNDRRLNYIGEGAFIGTNIREIILPENIKVVGGLPGATGSYYTGYTTIPSVYPLADKEKHPVFESDVTIYGCEKTDSERYANEFGLTFMLYEKELRDPKEYEKLLLDFITENNIDAKILYDEMEINGKILPMFYCICPNEEESHKIGLYIYNFRNEYPQVHIYFGFRRNLDKKTLDYIESVKKHFADYIRGEELEISEDGKTLLNYPSDSTEEVFVIPDGIETIGENAFHGAVNLKKVVFPETVRVIDRYAFYGCGFENIDFLPDSLEIISECAFGMNENLKSATIPKNVTELRSEYAGPFGFCLNLEEINFKRENPNIHQSPDSTHWSGDKEYYDTFYTGSEYGIGAYVDLLAIYVPDNSFELYAGAFLLDDFVLCKESMKNYKSDYEPQKNNIKGDANCDGNVNMADAVLIMQSLANPDKYGVGGTDETHITEHGVDNGDMDGNGLTNADALEIQKIILKIA